ncbi:MAG: family 20 glycosylhydrolase, partial [Armatimonadetes bacterium]|nr:family 20 glycosylhydrolase [Armatimonadota bacterium]
APREAQGYALTVTASGVAITGTDERGAWYGLQTLRQLVMRSPHGEAWLHGVEITDWPSLAFRGAHLFVGKHALPFHTRLISHIFGRFKLNALVLECEYSRWKSHPEIRVPEAMPLRDLRAEVEFARRRFLQPIPLIPSLSHTDWIFKNGRHLTLAEDPASPHAYDVSDPRSYQILFDVYREAIGIFRPSAFHIGHDELLSAGSSAPGAYPFRANHRGAGTAQLFSGDVWRIDAFLRAQNIRPMMWADMLLAPSDGNPARYPRFPAANAPTAAAAQEMRQNLPGDMILDDWRYEPGSEQRNGLNLFLNSGHDAIGCSWFQPQNIRGWALQCVRKGALGLLQTTWAGYNSGEALLHTQLRQFDAFVLAAEYSWSGTKLQPGDGSSPPAAGTLPWNARDVFIRSWSRSSQSTASGWTINLSQGTNMQLAAPRSHGLPWSAPRTASAAWSARDPLDGAVVQSEKVPTGVCLRSRLEVNRGEVGPGAIVLHPNARAGHIALLQACAFPSPDGTTVATVTLSYADGGQAELPLRYGRETGALDDNGEPAGMTTALIPWRADAAAAPLWLRICTLTNPQPGKRIAAIRIAAIDPVAAPVLFGITGW